MLLLLVYEQKQGRIVWKQRRIVFSFLCMLYNIPQGTSLHIGCGCFGCTLTTVSSQITSACHNFADTDHYACHIQHVGQTYRLSVCKKSL